MAAIVVSVLLMVLLLNLFLRLSAPLTYRLGRASYIGALIRDKLRTFVSTLRSCTDCKRI
jgi:hypothetical protein